MARPQDPWSVVLRRIEANGTFVVSITGNDGPGIFTVIAPASGGTISSAGSSDSPVTPYYTWRANVTDGSELRFVPSSPFVFPGSKLTVWYPGSAEELDDSVCQPLPAGTVHPEDPANTILLIDFDHCWADPDDGVTPITDKLGIPYVMFYQPEKYSTVEYGVTFIYDIKNTTGTFTGVVTISNADAQILSDKISQGVGVQVIIPTTPAESDMQIVYQPNEISGNQASRFSSWGPSLDGKLLPSVLAPGGNILSTFPSFLGNWGVVSGSSQATPLIAGVAALLLEKYPSLTPMELQALMSASAKPVKWNNEFAETLDYLAPVLQQGAGLLDAWAAANLTSRVNTSSLSFNDTANRPAHLAFSLSNVGSEAVTYTLANTGAASGYLLNSTSKYNLTGPEARPVYAELDISPASITLEPGAAAEVLVSVKAGPQLPDAATRGSFFGGYVSISSASDGELLSVPYTGFGTALKSLPMINRDTTYPAIVNETFLEKVEDGRVFNCLYNASITVGSPVRCPDGVYPGFQLNLVLPTRRYIFDIVRAGNTTAVALKNALSGGPLDVWTRNRFWYWDGTDGERAFLPAGKYVWRVTALRLYGDEETPDDFDVWYGNSWTLQFSADSILP
ncbi:hypothetical protein QTJ16_003773 [Diplocarpon rosae]|uniref:Uncharacterized protein n=1 Tax=Diplocarpon rosae TaxID=946125 RepID=A0AAD9WDV9_9HELO|nr:hypothetical protein QTJ16_003773 [Diplocarpon rosae]